MEPSTHEEWVEVAKERSQDARTLSDGKSTLSELYIWLVTPLSATSKPTCKKVG